MTERPSRLIRPLARSCGLYEVAFRRELELLGARDLAQLAAAFARADGVPVSAAHVERAVRALVSPQHAGSAGDTGSADLFDDGSTSPQ